MDVVYIDEAEQAKCRGGADGLWRCKKYAEYRVRLPNGRFVDRCGECTMILADNLVADSVERALLADRLHWLRLNAPHSAEFRGHLHRPNAPRRAGLVN